VVREVTETHVVTEVQTRMVPVVHWRLVPEQRVETYPVTVCRMINDTVRVRVPRLVFSSKPKTLVYKKAVLSCDEIPVTVYKPVMKMVPVVSPSLQSGLLGTGAPGVEVGSTPQASTERPPGRL
jgi:hypothetical protein